MNGMEIIDISWPISADMTTYKNRSEVSVQETRTFERDGWRESAIALGCHTGTHIDAPAHFIKNGHLIHQTNLSALLRPCLVLDMTHVTNAISRADIAPHAQDIHPGEAILFKTTNSALPATQDFEPAFVYLDESGARYLAEKKIAAVGIDYLGIERGNPQHPTHIALMEGGVIIIEGLRLGHVRAGRYNLICLPLNILGVEAAPARAVLVRE
jgi:arylformamidase